MFESVGNWLMLNEYPSYSYATNLVDEFYVDFYSYPPTFLFHVLNPTEKLKKKKCSEHVGFLCTDLLLVRASLVAQTAKCLPSMRETRVRFLAQEDSPGEGNGNPLQHSCLENPMDGGA